MKKIAYFQIFGKHPIEDSVRKMLVATFPELEVRPIVLMALLRKRPVTLAWNCLVVLKEYGTAILLGHKSFKSSFLSTTFLYMTVKKLARRQLSVANNEYAFSFQLQSLFDTSVPGTPHYVYTDHTHLANLEYPGYDKRRLNLQRWLELEKQIYANAVTIFTRSSNISRSLENDYACPSQKIACVFVGSNTQLTTLELNNDNYRNKNILFVGTDWERKGGPVLLQAFTRVLKTHPDATLTIVGCLPAANVPNCRIVGRQPIEALAKYYSNATVFCLPTLHEPFGVVFVEAMSHRLPIVATDVGAVPDLVSDHNSGILVSPGDEIALANALIELLNDHRKARLFGENGFQLVATRYNWESVGSAIRQRIAFDPD